MKTRFFQLKAKDFFHARPAGQFATAAAAFESMVMVCFGTEFADGKRAIQLMRLSRFNGQPFEVTVDGPDEAEAMETLETLLGELF